MKVSTRPTAVSRRKVEAPGAHHKQDIVGVALLALAVIIALSLMLTHVGSLGAFLGGFVKMMFGRGAWCVPIFFGGLGVAVITGHKQLPFRSVVWGLALLFFATIGMFANPGAAGDWFNPDSASASGGYLGAMISWIFDSLLGDFL